MNKLACMAVGEIGKGQKNSCLAQILLPDISVTLFKSFLLVAYLLHWQKKIFLLRYMSCSTTSKENHIALITGFILSKQLSLHLRGLPQYRDMLFLESPSWGLCTSAETENKGLIFSIALQVECLWLGVLTLELFTALAEAITGVYIAAWSLSKPNPTPPYPKPMLMPELHL